MTEKEHQWFNTTRAEFYQDLLTQRYPEIKQPDNQLGRLATEQGAEVVLRVADSLHGFETPDPSPEHLGAYAYIKFFARLVEGSRVQ